MRHSGGCDSPHAGAGLTELQSSLQGQQGLLFLTAFVHTTPDFAELQALWAAPAGVRHLF